MSIEVELSEAVSILEAAARPKLQIRRDKAIAGPSRVIQKIVRARLRSQLKAVLDSHALRRLHVTFNGTGGGSDSLPAGREARSSAGSHDRASLSQGNGSGMVREAGARSRQSSDRQVESDSGSEGESVRRVTGSVDAPLTDAGRKQAHELKERLGGNIAVFTAPNSRSRETGRIIADNAQDAEWLRPWGVGRYEGMTLDDARDAINRLVTDAPDEVPGTSRYSGRVGDSFNEVAGRLITGTVAQRATMKPGERVLNITSGRALHIIHAAALRGFHSIDKQELLKRHFSKPGDLFILGLEGLWKITRPVDDPHVKQQYFAQHGETDWNEGVAASESLREADDPQRAKIEADAAAALGQVIHSQPVTAEQQTAYAGAINKALVAGSKGVAEHLGAEEPLPGSFVYEYLTKSGFSQLTGEIDRTTTDRIASAIADAYESGADFDATVRAVKSEFAEMSQSRAVMIAQTELNDAFNQSVLHFGREAGAVKKSWQTDLAPCPVCVENALDGEIDMDEDFSSGDDAPPSHPNCMCSLLVHADL